MPSHLYSVSYGADIFVDFSVIMRTQIVASRCVNLAQNMPTTRLRPGLRPGPHWGSLQRSPDPLGGKEGPPGCPTEVGTPGMPIGRGDPREGEREEEKGRGGRGKNCCHQMSDFTAKMRGRAI